MTMTINNTTSTTISMADYKDAFGTPLSIGDKVLYARIVGSSISYVVGEVLKLTYSKIGNISKAQIQQNKHSEEHYGSNPNGKVFIYCRNLIKRIP